MAGTARVASTRPRAAATMPCPTRTRTCSQRLTPTNSHTHPTGSHCLTREGTSVHCGYRAARLLDYQHPRGHVPGLEAVLPVRVRHACGTHSPAQQGTSQHASVGGLGVILFGQLGARLDGYAKLAARPVSWPCRQRIRTAAAGGKGGAARTGGHVAHVNGRRPQAPHALADIGEVLEEVHVGRPRLVVLVTKPSHLQEGRVGWQG